VVEREQDGKKREGVFVERSGGAKYEVAGGWRGEMREGIGIEVEKGGGTGGKKSGRREKGERGAAKDE